MLEGQGHFEADYFVDGLRRTALKDPRTTANIATMAAKLAGLLLAEDVATAPIIKSSVAISKVYFIDLMQLIKLLEKLKN